MNDMGGTVAGDPTAVPGTIIDLVHLHPKNHPAA